MESELESRSRTCPVPFLPPSLAESAHTLFVRQLIDLGRCLQTCANDSSVIALHARYCHYCVSTSTLPLNLKSLPFPFPGRRMDGPALSLITPVAAAAMELVTEWNR